MSEFWIRKMRTHFRVIDADKNGVITKEDFELLRHRYCESENADPIRRERLTKSVENLWKSFMAVSPTAESEPLTETMLIETMKQHRNNPAYLASLKDAVQDYIDIVDTNADGFIQEDEHRRFFACMDVPNASSLAKTAFEAIDTDHDGKISRDEFIAAFVDFMVSEDEKSPFQLLYGYLV